MPSAFAICPGPGRAAWLMKCTAGRAEVVREGGVLGQPARRPRRELSARKISGVVETNVITSPRREENKACISAIE